MEYRPGALVRARERDWVVQPSPDPELVLLKPLGGSDEEITGIFLPLSLRDDAIKSTDFPHPSADDLGDISSARLLYNATRLAFRSGAGPFRSLAKLSFRPRSYQMVPLIMALKQEKPVRMFIADDVGVGKTVEALLILKELLERREIKRFAVIAPPHLCEQWQGELKDKFGIDAVVIRSNTQARLDREIQGDTSVYTYYPFQVISIDYIKGENRRQVFVNECPEFVIVDEVHTCAEPTGEQFANQQQRYALIRDISLKKNKHLVVLTATPHSGKPEQFQSIISFIKAEYINLDLPNTSAEQRQEFARHYVQRRRANVEKWMGEETLFPKRDSGEIAYQVAPLYQAFYSKVVDFALGSVGKKDQPANRARMRFWSALALLRGIMSSPAAGMEMIGNKLGGTTPEVGEEEPENNPIVDSDNDVEKDHPSAHVIDKTDWSDSERRKLNDFANELESLHGLNHDAKVIDAANLIEKWLREGFHPVIFCRYIATAKYVGKILKEHLARKFDNLEVQAITSEDPDEVRKFRIDEMSKDKMRVLVATDCLSEGINLQDKFTAVLHYDLPWNPNRLEQREGRIDRFGQPAKEVRCFLYYGKNNPMDGVVLRVLLRKVQEIRKSTGISIPFPEDSKPLMDAVLQAVLLSRDTKPDSLQTSIYFGEFDIVRAKELEVTRAYNRAAEREKASRSIFAQYAIKAEEIEQDLHESDEATGTPKAVEAFITETLTSIFGVQISPDKKGYLLFTTNLPDTLKILLPSGNRLKVSFHSPVPEGYFYLGRNHPFVEQICHILMANAMKRGFNRGPARSAVIRCREVLVKTVLLLFRVRNVIQEKESSTQLVAEEMLIWGYEGQAAGKTRLSTEKAMKLIETARPSLNMSDPERQQWIGDELSGILLLGKEFDAIAMDRAGVLIEAHERFRKVLGGMKYKVVEPVLPMDLVGVYILLPHR